MANATTTITFSWEWPTIESVAGSGIYIQDPKVVAFLVQTKKGLGNWLDLEKTYTNSVEITDVIDAVYSGRVAAISVYGAKSEWVETSVTVANTGASLNNSNRTTQDMRARAIPDSGETLITVAGYYSPNDGGAGQYYADLTDTTTPDDGGSCIVTNAGVRMRLITNLQNVSAIKFGFIGLPNIDQFSPDYTANLERALAYASIRTAGGFSIDVVIDPGKYKITRKVIIPSGVNLICNGILINYLTNSLDPVLEGLDGASISRLLLDANGKLGIKWAGNSFLNNVTLLNVGNATGNYGILLDNASNVTLSNIDIQTGFDTLLYNQCNNISLSGTNLHRNPRVTGVPNMFKLLDVDRGALKAWITFAAPNPGTIAIVSRAYNISVFTRLSLGAYGITFTTPFQSATSYAMAGSGRFDTGASNAATPIIGFYRGPNSKQANYCEVVVDQTSNDTNIWALDVTIGWWGD